MPVKVKLPSLSVTDNLTIELSFAFCKLIDAALIAFPFSSFTTPLMRWACTKAVKKKQIIKVKNLFIIVVLCNIGTRK